MKKTLTIALALTLLAGTGTAFAQPGRDDHRTDNHRPAPAMAMRGPAHPEWRQGGHIARTDWRRGEVINYRDHHLRRPPRGYEWRQVDGNFVLAAVTTGLIASIILAGH